ncbi:DMT family transporter [Peptococcaceae bacterium 1198_IL3148]
MLNGYLQIILTAIGFAALPVITKLGYNLGLTEGIMLLLRFLIASVTLVFLLLMSKSNRFYTYKSYLPQLVVHGLVFFGSAYCYTLSIKYMSATITNILLYTYPLMVVLMSTFIFKEKITLIKGVTLLTTFFGCLLVIDVISMSTQQMSRLGVLYGIGSAVFYAIYNINGQYLAKKKLQPLTITTYTSIVCLLATVIVFPPVNAFVGHSYSAMCLVGLGTALLCTVMPLFCYAKGIAVLGASRASILSNIEPVFAIVLAGLLLGDRLTIIQLTGALLIIFGAMLLKLDEVKHPNTLNHSVTRQV